MRADWEWISSWPEQDYQLPLGQVAQLDGTGRKRKKHPVGFQVPKQGGKRMAGKENGGDAAAEKSKKFGNDPGDGMEGTQVQPDSIQPPGKTDEFGNLIPTSPYEDKPDQ